MQPAVELVQLARLVRSTADAVVLALQKHVEPGAVEPLDPGVVRVVKAELGFAFQSLARAAQALDLDKPRERKPRV